MSKSAKQKSSPHRVHEALKGLDGVAQAEGHEGEFEDALGNGNGSLLCIVGMDGNLDMWSGEGTTEKLVRVIMNVLAIVNPSVATMRSAGE
jgi:hypothetical protein